MKSHGGGARDRPRRACDSEPRALDFIPMDMHRELENLRTCVEGLRNVPEGIEFYTWWRAPYDAAWRGMRLMDPFEQPGCMATSGYLPDCFTFPTVRATVWLLPGPLFPPAAAGWDTDTRQAVLFVGNGYGKMPRHEPGPASGIDRLAEQGTAFLEEGREKKFRAMVRKLVVELEEGVRDMDISWEERERIQEMKERVKDW